MSTAPKIAQRLANPGSFHVEQQQRLAQDTARKVNSFADTLGALTNRSYAALAVDSTLATAASYATLLTANITTVLASGYLIITFSTSAVKITAVGNMNFRIVVDGVAIKAAYSTAQVVNTAMCAAMVVRVAVTKGAHVVQLQWQTNSNSMRINAASTPEEHANLLVQEAA